MNYTVKHENRVFNPVAPAAPYGSQVGARLEPTIRRRETNNPPAAQQSAVASPGFILQNTNGGAPSGFIVMKTSGGAQPGLQPAACYPNLEVTRSEPQPQFSPASERPKLDIEIEQPQITPAPAEPQTAIENIKQNWRTYLPLAGAAGGTLVGLSYMQSGLNALREAGKVTQATPSNDGATIVKALATPILLGIATLGAIAYLNREPEEITKLKIEKGYI